MKILGLSGSIRKASFNTAALRAAQELVPAGSSLTIARIDDLPHYDDDVRVAGYPEPVPWSCNSTASTVYISSMARAQGCRARYLPSVGGRLQL